MRFKDKIQSKVYTFVIDKMFRLSIIFPEKAKKIMSKKRSKSTDYFFKERLGINPTLKLIRRIYTDLNPRSRKKLIECFLVNQYIIGKKKRDNYEKKYNIPIPINLLISITNQCNLNCKYCYGPRGDKKVELPYEVIDRAITEAKNLGTYWNVLSGGEPFLRKDIFRIFEKHKDVAFTVFTNGLKIDRKIAKKLAKLGNVMPAISIEGFKENTDNRRGKGVFDKIMKSMDILKKEGVPFSFSVTVTKYNVDEVSREDFVNLVVSKGAFIGFYPQYIPTGRDIRPENLTPPSKKIELANKLLIIRQKIPIFIDDFQHKYVDKSGCKGVLGTHLHINVNGDITPCFSTNFASDNIKNTSLEKALRSKYLTMIRNIKSLKNGAKPCIILHNPKMLKRIIQESDAYSTEKNAERIYTDLSDLVINYSREYEKRILNEK